MSEQKLDNFCLFPPFTSDFGLNIHVGRNMFINSGCKFQDQGGIYIGDDTLIGHNVLIATLNHEQATDKRGNLWPKPVKNGKQFTNSNVTIVQGVTVGDGQLLQQVALLQKMLSP